MSIRTGELADRFTPRILLITGLLALIYVSLQFCTIEIWTTGGVLLGLIVMRRAAQSFCNTPLTLVSLRQVPDDQLRMATGLFSLHRNLAGAVGVALSATLLESRAELRAVQYAEQQILYPMGVEQATEAIQEVLILDGQTGAVLEQMTSSVLRQQLEATAALTSYHDMFAMFAVLSLVCLIPTLIMRRSPGVAPRKRASRRPSAFEPAPQPSERR